VDFPALPADTDGERRRQTQGDRPVTTSSNATPAVSTGPSLAPPRILIGQKALVTGANSGIGRGVAIALGQAGADIVVNYVEGAEAAQAVVDEIQGFGVRAIAHQADVSSEDQVAAMFKRMIGEFGTIDVLVANAGLQRDSAFHAMTLAQWQMVLNVNLTGQFLCAREAIREFLRRGVVPAVSCAAGKIICMSSVHQQIPWGGHANYATSKGGIKLMMESLAQEIAPRRIRVNGIAPGAIRTPINKSAWDTKEAYDQLMTLIPYGRIGEPEDIARAAVWLASDQSDYVVGSTLYVDGGMTLYPGFATGG
jgi:glucose 1-dehydrogenase